jgi:CDP-paratose 2-epimerase
VRGHKERFSRKPRPGAVYNLGGGRFSNCSMLEAIAICQRLTGKRLNRRYAETNRKSDHIWWISDTRRFRDHYPEWRQHYDIEAIIADIHDGLSRRLRTESRSGLPR